MKSASRPALTRTASVAIGVVIVVAAVIGVYYTISTAGSQSSTSNNTSTSGSNSSIPVYLGFAGTADITDLPALLLWQQYAPQLGVNLHIEYLQTDASIPESLISGGIQIGESGIRTVIQANQQAGGSAGPYPLVAFTSYEATNDFGLIVSNSIHSWSDLANKPIADEAVGSDTELFCHLYLTTNGVPANEQNCLPTGDPGARLDALLAGKVVGDCTEPFQMVEAIETGQFHILASVANSQPNLLSSVLYTTKTFAQAHPDIITKISEAMMLAHRWAFNETAWVAREQAAFPGSNVTYASAAWKVWVGQGLWGVNGGFGYSNVNYAQNYYVQQGYITSPLQVSDFTNFSFEKTALSTIGNYTGPAGGYVNPNIPSLNITLPGYAALVAPLLSMSGGIGIHSSGVAPWMVAVPLETARR